MADLKNEKSSEGNRVRFLWCWKDPTRVFPSDFGYFIRNFFKTSEKKLPHPNGTSTNSLLRLGQRINRLFQEKNLLTFKRTAMRVNSWEKKSVPYWCWSRRKKASSSTKSTTTKSVIFAITLFAESFPWCCQHRTELFFGPKKVIWFSIKNGISLKPFLRPRLYLLRLDFRNSGFSDFFLFFVIFLLQTASSFVLSALTPPKARRVLLDCKGRGGAG